MGEYSLLYNGEGRYPANLASDGEVLPDKISRFFYSPKSSRGEREYGLFDLKKAKADPSGEKDQPSMNGGKGNPHNRGVIEVHNNHPTVKPIDLCRWLSTLLLPIASVGERRLLVPFSGSGSEMIGALKADWDFVLGVEREAEYCELAKSRIESHYPYAEYSPRRFPRK